MIPKAEYLFEASWEVCNKVGGIYTVVKSKSPAMVENYKNYFLIGPYFEDKARHAFIQEEPSGHLKEAFKEMEASHNVKCYYGTWQIESDPKAILLDTSKMKIDLNEVKKLLWDNYGIDSLHASWDFNEPLKWSWAVGLMLGQVCEANKNSVLHCHEWMAGFAILCAKKHCKNLKTVFTTHATMLGRTIAGNGLNLYEILDTMNPEEKAYDLRVEEKHTTEKACAHAADVFTTVSKITGLEAEKILGRKPDILLNNGLNVENFPTVEEASIMHVKNREILREFITYFFFPYYTFDLDHTLIYYIVGRYEYKNKGIDLVIEALGKLNEQLKKENSNRTVVMFFWIPMSNRGIKQEVMDNKTYYVQIKNTLDRHSDNIMTKLLRDVVSQSCSVEESIFASDYLKNLKKSLTNFKRTGNPPLSTHEILNEDKDQIIQNLLRVGLDNKEDDRVKAIVYPVYLDGNDHLIDLTYYDALSAAHLGLFPSYYEPWGYTPVESMSMGVPAVTTDLAGFGMFVKPKLLENHPGAWVLDRLGKSREKSVEELFKIMHNFAELDHAERVQNKINAKQMSILTDWKHFVKNYIEAHNKAIES